MIVTVTGQYTICTYNEITHYKISFIFTIYSIIKRYPTCEHMEHYDFKTCGVYRECEDDRTRHNLFFQKYSDYKVSSIFVIFKMIEQYTDFEDIIELSKLLCCTQV